MKGEKIKNLTHNVPQAVIIVQGAAGLRMCSGMAFGFCVSGVDVTDSGVPLCSSVDHLLLEPFHLKKEYRALQM